jgi:hypothetical protein
LIARRRTIVRRGVGVLTGVITAGLLIAMPIGANAAAPHKQLAPYLPTKGNYVAPRHIDNLSYGGAKLQVTNTNYVIFWEPSKLQDGSNAYVSPTYNSLIQRYFGDVGGNGLYNNNTQYYETVHHKKKFIKNVSTLGGVWLDTSAYPKNECNDPATGSNCVTDTEIRAEVGRAIAANGWKATSKNMFFVFTSKGEGSCGQNIGVGCSFSSFCAYHYFFGKTMYANMPYAGTDLGGCGTPQSPNNDFDADSTINVTSHEQMEAVTDGYYPNGWNSPQGEIGDLCAWNFGPLGFDGGKANEQWNGNFYILQQEWSNKQVKCVQSGP